MAVKDSSKIVLTFDNDTSTIFTDSGRFNLVELRKKMEDKGINSDSIQITGIEVGYDETTKKFLTDNEGVKFFLKIYTRDNDTGVPQRWFAYKPIGIDAQAAVLLPGQTAPFTRMISNADYKLPQPLQTHNGDPFPCKRLISWGIDYFDLANPGRTCRDQFTWGPND